MDMEELNKLSLQTAENCLTEEAQKAYGLIMQMYRNIQNDCFLLAKRRMEIMLFRLCIWRYYDISDRIPEADHRLYCLQTEEGNAYRELVNEKLSQGFDKKKGIKAYETGMDRYGEKRYGESLHAFRKGALMGNGAAAYECGIMTSKGIGCTQDTFLGSFWLWQAAQLGDEQGMAGIGNHYYQGIGVWHSKTRGMYWYAQAALRHNPKAIMNIGISLEREEVIVREQALGRTFMRASADIQNALNERAASFVESNAKVILELMQEQLNGYEGGL